MAGVLTHTAKRTTVVRRVVGDARITVERDPARGGWRFTIYRPDARCMGGPVGWPTQEAAFEAALTALRREDRCPLT
jgi:hypothetical protein